MRTLAGATLEDLTAWCTAYGQPRYRAKQIFRWLFERRASDFAQMTDLPLSFREQLKRDWQVFSTSLIRASHDEDDTCKLLIGLADGNSVETVLLHQDDRWTACLSTQVGCGMGCVFCASGLDGVARNLSAGEIVEQMLRVREEIPTQERLTHLVIMGMGEPLANLDNLLEALEVATSPTGLGISARHITVSTVGLPAKIRQLAESNRPYHLAVSLHAPNDQLRQQIVPMSEKVSIYEILDASDEYRLETKRQVTFEYVLLAGVNDQPSHATQLAGVLGGRDAFVNLIPYNPVEGLPYRTPPMQRVGEFASILQRAGFAVKIRKRKGRNIDAACGQLRRSVFPVAGPAVAVDPRTAGRQAT